MGEEWQQGQEAWNLPLEVRAGTANSKQIFDCVFCFVFFSIQTQYNAIEVDSIENILSPIMVGTEKAYFKSDNKPAVHSLSGVLWFLRVQEKRLVLRCMTSFGIVRAGFKRPLEPVPSLG